MLPWKGMLKAVLCDKQTKVYESQEPAQQKQLPADYTVPMLQLRDMWDCWFHGNAHSPPLKDIQLSGKIWKLYAMDRHFCYKRNTTALYKCRECIKDLNPLDVCDICVASKSETYFNDGCSLLQTRFPSFNVSKMAAGTLYDKMNIARLGEGDRGLKRQRNASAETNADDDDDAVIDGDSSKSDDGGGDAAAPSLSAASEDAEDTDDGALHQLRKQICEEGLKTGSVVQVLNDSSADCW
jgi:hypothetical protein